MIHRKLIVFLLINTISLILLFFISFSSAGETKIRNMNKLDKKSFQRIAAGTALFQLHHDLAPSAQLKIRLYPRKKSVNYTDIKLILQNASTQTMIILDSELRFIPPDKSVTMYSAELVSNQPEGSLLWYADIHTPGLPAGTRRLGDLRLECLVNLALNGRPVKQLQQNCFATAEVKCLDIWMDCISYTLAEVGGIIAGAFIPVSFTPEPYEQKNRFRSVFISDNPLFGITLSYADKSITLPSTYLYAGATQESISADPSYNKPDLLGNFYELPLDNSLLPDDTLVWFEYMDN